MRLELTVPQLKVVSAVSSNFAVLWLGAILTTHDFFLLTMDLLLAMVSVYFATKAEEAILYG